MVVRYSEKTNKLYEEFVDWVEDFNVEDDTVIWKKDTPDYIKEKLYKFIESAKEDERDDNE